MKILMLVLFINLSNLNLSNVNLAHYPFYSPLHYEYGNRGGTLTEDKNIMLRFNHKYKYLFLKLEVDTSNCKSTVKYKIKNPNGSIIDEGEIKNSNNSFIIEKCYEKQFTDNNPWYIEFSNLSKGDSLKFELYYRAKNIKLKYPNEKHESF